MMLKMHRVKQCVHFMNIQAVYPYHLFFLLYKEMDVVYSKAGNSDKRPWWEGDSMVLCAF